MRQQKALLEEAAATIEKERLEARDMLKVPPKIEEVIQKYHDYVQVSPIIAVRTCS